MVHIAQSATPEFREIRERLRRLRVRLGILSAEAEATHPDWQRGVDARLSGFGKLANVVESAELSLKFLDEELLLPEWWQRTYGFVPSMSDLSIYVVEFSQYSKTGLLQLSFGSLESTVRIFLRSIAPLACHGATTEFKAVYECLFRTHLAGFAKAIPLLDLLRMLRNTVHNNGVYFHKSGKDAVCEYKGVSYKFPIGRPVEFATWLLVADLLGDAVELLNDVVSSPQISGIAGPLVDPYSHPSGT